jgi:pimeloyl-ACP methyl ester carboxylesterase
MAHELESSRLRWIMSLWACNYTPQSLVRIFGQYFPTSPPLIPLTGPFSASYVKQAVVRRFGTERWTEEQSDLIANYFYLISALPPSGEYSLNSILLPLAHREGADGEDRINYAVYTRNRLKPKDFVIYASEASSPPPSPAAAAPNHCVASAPVAPSSVIETTAAESACETVTEKERCKVPILVLYGDDDWIAFPEVRKYVEKMQSYQIDATLRIVPRAGHHLYMDNKEDVIRTIDSWWGRVATYE